MRVLLCGGGTGGHVMPAIAIAEIIEKSFDNTVIAFAGRKDGDENMAYLATGHKLYTVDIQGLSRSLSINSIKTVFKAIRSGRFAREAILDFKPDIIIGTGGYVCFPFIRQGQRMRIKTAIHESNVYPGLVTRLLGKRCDKLLLNHEGTLCYLGRNNNAVVVGNPIRSAFSSVKRDKARRRLGVKDGQLLVVSFGGSLGAKVMNECLIDYFSDRIDSGSNIRYIHATGRSYFDKTKADNPLLFLNREDLSIVPYIDDVPTLLTAADLAITRSGAITLSELCASSTPSILIPSPNVSADHQYINAKYMQDNGASVLIEEKDLTPKELKRVITALVNDRDHLRKMRYNAHRLHKDNTNDMIVKEVIDLLED